MAAQVTENLFGKLPSMIKSKKDPHLTFLWFPLLFNQLIPESHWPFMAPQNFSLFIIDFRSAQQQICPVPSMNLIPAPLVPCSGCGEINCLCGRLNFHIFLPSSSQPTLWSVHFTIPPFPSPLRPSVINPSIHQSNAAVASAKKGSWMDR